MRIGFTTFGCDSGRSGIGKYAIALLKEIATIAPEHEVIVATTRTDASIYDPQLPNVVIDSLNDGLNSVRKSLIWHVASLGNWARRRKLDVLFIPAGNRRLPWSCPCPVVATVHDLSAFHVDAKYDPMRLVYIRKVLPRLIGSVDRVVTISQSSLHDIQANTSARQIAVIPNGYNSEQFMPTLRNKIREAGLVPYWIYVSRLEHPGKNHVKLMQAYETILSDGVPTPDLALAGADWDGADAVHRHHAASPARDRIRFLGFVSDADLPDLVAQSEGCVYPSLYEGFGIPIVEAMASGVPVACSNTSSLPEVGGDAALYFDPSSVAAIAGALRKLRDDPSLRADLVARGLDRAKQYTWRSCAQRTLAEIVAAGGAR